MKSSLAWHGLRAAPNDVSDVPVVPKPPLIPGMGMGMDILILAKIEDMGGLIDNDDLLGIDLVRELAGIGRALLVLLLGKEQINSPRRRLGLGRSWS